MFTIVDVECRGESRDRCQLAYHWMCDDFFALCKISRVRTRVDEIQVSKNEHLKSVVRLLNRHESWTTWIGLTVLFREASPELLRGHEVYIYRFQYRARESVM